MKKTLFFVISIIFSIVLNAFEIVSEEQTGFPDAKYPPEKSKITFDELNNKIYFIQKNKDNEKGVYSVKEGEEIVPVGIHGSRKRGGIRGAYSLAIDSSKVFVQGSSRTTAFNTSTDELLYCIDSDVSLNCSFAVSNGMLYGSHNNINCYTKIIEDKIALCAQILVDEEYPEDRILNLKKRFMPYVKYKKEMKLDAASFLKKEKEDVNPVRVALCETMASEGLTDEVEYVFTEEYIMCASVYGTELYIYDYDFNVVSVIQFDSFHEIRLDEIENRNKIKKAGFFSRLNRIMLDAENEKVLIHYITGYYTNEKIKSKNLLITVDLKSGIVSNLIPINFSPVAVQNSTIIGVSNENKKTSKIYRYKFKY